MDRGSSLHLISVMSHLVRKRMGGAFGSYVVQFLPMHWTSIHKSGMEFELRSPTNGNPIVAEKSAPI